jgi:hypothetical protein
MGKDMKFGIIHYDSLFSCWKDQSGNMRDQEENNLTWKEYDGWMKWAYVHPEIYFELR